MMRTAIVAAFALTVALTGTWIAGATQAPSARSVPAMPPVAKTAPRILEAHGQLRVDEYYWLRDKNDPDVIAYLNAENAYAAARLARLDPLIAELRSELRSRTEFADASPPYVDSRYIYRRRIAKGASHPLIVRHRDIPGAAEQVVLDVERLAAGHKHYELEDYIVSPDGNSVAFAADLTGGRMHRIFIRNIATGAVTDTGIKDAASDLVFSADSQWLFYIRVDPATVRSHQLWRHAIGKPGVPDQLLYEETDPTFDLQLARSKSGKFVLLNISQQQSSEVRYLRSDLPLGPLRILERRRTGVVYDADHIADTFYIRTNLDAPDFRVMRAPQDAPHAANWTELIGETPGRLLADIELFESFIALVEEANANQSIKVFRFSDRRLLPVPVPDSVGVMELTLANGNRNTAATMLRVRFSSPNHPEAIYDFDTQNEAMFLRKHSPAWTWFDPAIYTVERVSIAAADGESIPVTLTYRKDRRRAGGNPVLITGYGAYGSSESPGFTESWASLIDRGFVLAQAHVRGGQEKGVRWYDQGRMLNKPNSFNDFIAATEALIERGYADPRRVFARGGSAGGLLVAVAAARRPDLYAGVVAEVPFVDVVTTMSDPTIPLTTLEYQEWGNPAIKEQYATMMSYSPYDNVTAKALPPMLVTAAFNDSQVGFHEPAKWVARLRAARTDGNELLLLTNMSGGHTGAAGRFGANTVDATIMAWLVARANKPD